MWADKILSNKHKLKKYIKNGLGWAEIKKELKEKLLGERERII